jgi:hypothetical protein
MRRPEAKFSHRMFMTESGSASLPPLSSLGKSIPNLGKVAPGPTFPRDATRARHGANLYYQPCDAAVRRAYGEPATAGDYGWQGHLATEQRHNAVLDRGVSALVSGAPVSTGTILKPCP